MNPENNWQKLIANLTQNINLSRGEAQWAMAQMMSGQAAKEDIIDFLLALKAKGESQDEISGFIDVMLENSVKVPVTSDAIDIVGTGGDQLGTVNISTMAAIVIAACGYPVLKHGSRSASGKTGSSEMLEALGIKLDLTPEQLAQVFDKTSITFFFAPLFHPSLKHVAPIRKEMGVPTTFNFLGPLANPVQPLATALGVAKAGVLPLMANEIKDRNRSAVIFRGSDGLDELTITGNSQITLVHAGDAKSFEFSPTSLGISPAGVQDLIGGDAQTNAAVARGLFEGVLGEHNPIFQIVALNAAAGLTAYELAKSAGLDQFNFEDSLARNFVAASQAIISGKAKQKLIQWIVSSNSFGE